MKGQKTHISRTAFVPNLSGPVVAAPPRGEAVQTSPAAHLTAHPTQRETRGSGSGADGHAGAIRGNDIGASSWWFTTNNAAAAPTDN